MPLREPPGLTRPPAWGALQPDPPSASQPRSRAAPRGHSTDTDRDMSSSSSQSHRSTLGWIQGNKGIYQKANENLQEIKELQGGDFFPQVILPP